MRRESWGTDIRYSLDEHSNISMTTSLLERNCGTAPHPLTWKASVSLLILIPQILGFFWCEVGLYKPIHSVPKNNKVIFFLYWNHFRSQLRLWYSDISSIVSPTTGLTRVPYNLFGSYCSVIFILNPYSREELFQKSSEFILGST